MVAVACTPTSPVARSSACRIVVTDADANDVAAYDENKYPQEPQIKYIVAIVDSDSEVQGVSPVFSPNPDDGTALPFPDYIFPKAGTFTVALMKTSDLVTPVATATVTAS